MITASSRSKNLRSPLRDMLKEAKRVQATGKEMFYFNIGDPNKFDFDTPQPLKDELAKATENNWGYYAQAEGEEELLSAIVSRENKENGASILENDVVVTSGVSEAVLFLMGAMLEKGDEILLPGPCYYIYLQWSQFFDGVPVTYEMDEKNNWQANLDDLEKKINEKTRAIVVINPNNPTGSIADKKTLEEIINIAGQHKLSLVSDEIYDRLVFGETKYHPIASLANDVPVIVLNGFSKTFLMPGWRVGYVYFQDKNEELNEVKEAIKAEARQRLSACTPVMKACAKAFEHQEHLEVVNRKLKERGEYSWKRFNEMNRISAIKPQGAFYIFPKVELDGRWKTDEEFCLDVIRSTGIVFPYGSGFDPVYGKGHFRSVILPPVEMMERAFDKLESFMKG